MLKFCKGCGFSPDKYYEILFRRQFVIHYYDTSFYVRKTEYLCQQNLEKEFTCGAK